MAYLLVGLLEFLFKLIELEDEANHHHVFTYAMHIDSCMHIVTIGLSMSFLAN